MRFLSTPAPFAALLVTLLVIFLAAAPARAADTSLTISGDPCSLPLASALASAYSGKKPGFAFELETVSCTRGVYRAAYGEADIGVSTQNGLAYDLPKGATVRVVARSPIVAVVNRANPVDDLTFDELRRIYSGEITNWREVGGPDMAVENVMLQPCVKHTMSKKVIIYGEIRELKPDGKVNPVTHTNVMVAENPAAIGQQIYGYHTDDVKVLTIDGRLPTADNGGEGYPFYQDFNVVTRGEPAGAAREFIDFAYSEDARTVIEELNHIPVGRD